MRFFSDSGALLQFLNGLNHFRVTLENEIQRHPVVPVHCAYCGGIREARIRQDSAQWVDLRNEFVCSGCGMTSRERLLFESLQHFGGPSRSDRRFVMHERVTPFFSKLAVRFPEVLGVEYGGSDLQPGASFVFGRMMVQHEDMQALSFADETIDLISHSDVLEHVPDPWKAMREIFRVLKPGGRCIFACPIYSIEEHIQRAYLDDNGDLIFTRGPAYHGDPLREGGVPVFYQFGFCLLEDLKEIGFKVQFGVFYSLMDGYVSNNNPYAEGHMWPLIVVCEKPAG